MDVTQVLPRDAIPSVDDPSFEPRYDGDPDDEVIVVEGSPARAYPVRYLHFHEIVNADCDGEPVAVTWCPLCGSAVVYDRTVATGEETRTLTFGVSGKLADDDLVMYDRETETEWKQSSGRAIAGPLADAELSVRPAAVTTYGAFERSHPDGEVLAAPGGQSEAASDDDDPAEIDYGEDPYRPYFEGDGFGLAAHRGETGRKWDRADLDPKAVVLGIEVGDDAVGFPADRVAAAGGAVTATVGGREVVVVAADGLHAFEREGMEVQGVGDGRLHADGTTWDPATGESGDGRTLSRVPARRLFAFAWQDDHGPDAFYG